MTKQQLKDIIDKYQTADDEVSQLDRLYGICIYNAYSENFFNKYNWIIFKLLEYQFGAKNIEMIENYIFKQVDMTFDELCEALEVYD